MNSKLKLMIITKAVTSDELAKELRGYIPRFIERFGDVPLYIILHVDDFKDVGGYLSPDLTVVRSSKNAERGMIQLSREI